MLSGLKIILFASLCACATLHKQVAPYPEVVSNTGNEISVCCSSANCNGEEFSLKAAETCKSVVKYIRSYYPKKNEAYPYQDQRFDSKAFYNIEVDRECKVFMCTHQK